MSRADHPASAVPTSWTSSKLPDPEPQPGQQVYEVSAAGTNFADTHQQLSVN
jgi:NADPH:quinone reductase-like Zn-dependent oxidoreductase